MCLGRRSFLFPIKVIRKSVSGIEFMNCRDVTIAALRNKHGKIEEYLKYLVNYTFVLFLGHMRPAMLNFMPTPKPHNHTRYAYRHHETIRLFDLYFFCSTNRYTTPTFLFELKIKRIHF